MESVGAPPDTTEWVGSICPPLLEDFASSSAECPSTQSLVSGQVVNGDDSASMTPFRETTSQCTSGIKGGSKEDVVEAGTFCEVEIKGAGSQSQCDHTKV